MKKFLISAFSCLMIISVFTACEKKNNEQKPQEEVKTYFTIEVSDIDATNATVTVTPTDPAITYLFSAVPTSEYNEDSITSRYNKAFFDDILDFYAYFGETIHYADLFYTGKDVQHLNDLQQETAYTVFAVGVDTVSFELSTPVVTTTFRTLKWVKKGAKELSFDDVDFMDAVDNYGWWQMLGYSISDESHFYYLTVSPEETNTVSGNYTMEDMDTDYTYLRYYTVANGDTTYQHISFIDGLFEVKETETGAEMYAVVNGSDGYEYTLNVVGTYSEDEEDYAPARRRVAVKRNRAVGVKK